MSRPRFGNRRGVRRAGGPARALGCAFVVLAVARGAAGAADPASPTAGPVVESIEWSGTEAVAPAEIAPYLFTTARPWWKPWDERPPFDEGVLEADVHRIAAVYRDHGYYRARASYTLEWNAMHDAVRIRIDVDEGPPVRIDSWGVDLSELPGDEAHWRQRLVTPLPLHVGDVFTLDRYGEAKRMLLDGLADRGFPDATQSGGGDVDVERGKAVVWWRVHPGASVKFGEIRVEGLGEVKESIVRGELTFASGEGWSQNDLEQSQRKLYDLGLFLSVVVAPDLEDASSERGYALTPDVTLSRPVLVTVKERKPRSVRLGAGYGTEDKLRVQAGWIHRNVFGRADKLEARARYSSLGMAIESTLREPRLPDDKSVTTVRIRFERQTEPAYDANTAGGRLLVERRLSRHWTGRAGYDVEWTDVTDTRAASEREFTDPTGRFFLSYFELGARWNDTDNELDPTRGTWLDVAASPSGRAIGSDFDYVRWTVEGRGYLPVGPTVLASRMLLGTIAPFAGTRETELPITKLFYGGGSNSVRGYGYQRLGNTDSEGDPVGGASLLEGTLELRFPIWSALRGVAFVDGGTISPDAWTWSTSHLLWAAGAGLRYSTPLGPLRLDAGFPLNAPGGVQGYRIWLSIGQAF